MMPDKLNNSKMSKEEKKKDIQQTSQILYINSICQSKVTTFEWSSVLAKCFYHPKVVTDGDVICRLLKKSLFRSLLRHFRWFMGILFMYKGSSTMSETERFYLKTIKGKSMSTFCLIFLA